MLADPATARQQLSSLIEGLAEEFVRLSDDLWDHPETRYREDRSCAAHVAVAQRHGFRITPAAADIPTAFIAEAGMAGPVIAILGEYDALPGLSQQAGATQQIPLTPDGPGHGCGHNLLGAGALLAATALARWLERSGLPGRVRYYGCPAEEGGSGKTFMVRAGCFDDVDAALTWHPGSLTGIIPSRSLANIQAYVRFHGRASHAALSPEMGRSALDALELTSVGVQYLREHLPQHARLHGTILSTNPAPNVIPDHAEAIWLIRSAEQGDLADIFERFADVAKGAGLMTGTRLELEFDKACSALLRNGGMDQLLHEELQALPTPGHSPDDAAFAAGIRATLRDADIAAAYRFLGAQVPETAPILHDGVMPLPDPGTLFPGSTDVGDVSWCAPLSQCFVASHVCGTPLHSWQLVAQGKSAIAHRSMRRAAQALASAGARLFCDEALLAAVVAEHRASLSRQAYLCPIGPEVALPFLRHRR